MGSSASSLPPGQRLAAAVTQAASTRPCRKPGLHGVTACTYSTNGDDTGPAWFRSPTLELTSDAYREIEAATVAFMTALQHQFTGPWKAAFTKRPKDLADVDALYRAHDWLTKAMIGKWGFPTDQVRFDLDRLTQDWQLLVTHPLTPTSPGETIRISFPPDLLVGDWQAEDRTLIRRAATLGGFLHPDHPAFTPLRHQPKQRDASEDDD